MYHYDNLALEPITNKRTKTKKCVNMCYVQQGSMF